MKKGRCARTTTSQPRTRSRSCNERGSLAQPKISYDEESGTLQFAFVPNRGATGLELNENILLRVDTAAREAVGLTLFNFSVLAQLTELGPRSVPLTGLAEMTAEMREMALGILRRAPVAECLRLSTYTPAGGPGELVPITSVHPLPAAGHAA